MGRRLSGRTLRRFHVCTLCTVCGELPQRATAGAVTGWALLCCRLWCLPCGRLLSVPRGRLSHSTLSQRLSWGVKHPLRRLLSSEVAVTQSCRLQTAPCLLAPLQGRGRKLAVLVLRHVSSLQGKPSFPSCKPLPDREAAAPVGRAGRPLPVGCRMRPRWKGRCLLLLVSLSPAGRMSGYIQPLGRLSKAAPRGSCRDTQA